MSSSNLLSLETCHVILQIILVVIFSHRGHAILSVRLSWGLSSVTENTPCYPSDYPGGYLRSLRTCHIVHQIIPGVIFSHWGHAMLSVRLSRGLSSVTEDMPRCPSDYPGGYLKSLRTCHVVRHFIPGVIFSHWGHATLSVILSRGLSSVTEDMPRCPSDYPGGYLQSLRTCHVVRHFIPGLSSVTEDMPCCPSDYPGGYLRSLRTCHVVRQIIPGVIFSHWGYAMLSFTFYHLHKKMSSFVTDDIPS